MCKQLSAYISLFRILEACWYWRQEAVWQGISAGLSIYASLYPKTRGPASYHWCGSWQGKLHLWENQVFQWELILTYQTDMYFTYILEQFLGTVRPNVIWIETCNVSELDFPKTLWEFYFLLVRIMCGPLFEWWFLKIE